ncbi:(4Fe-4S)-binding protein [Marinirhabdus gelatinilytica]|uniref:Putative Fe-S cluster protein YjdI n=1 Tax=Marinirhabdus gelatinilytica TaxID=1703343 RepID=A0A370Q8H0_9FLAO|nr:(4Fe-4S)-binding protein [Marinirhabdus gelatinilytica]RDK84661.1 putative Fe-S cluster protein YjdI [Marinirhabdus gelatinilytica]
MEKVKEYTNGKVTVVWKPELCIHSAKCVHDLPEVFKPKDKPWVQVENATTSDIVATVKGCPSGALSYFMNEIGPAEIDTEMKKETTKIEVMKNGPLMVLGSVAITHDDGREELKEKRTAFCRCGHSNNQPFCDGSHNA